MGIDYEKFPDVLYSNTEMEWMNQDEFDVWIKCFNDYVNLLKESRQTFFCTYFTIINVGNYNMTYFF